LAKKKFRTEPYLAGGPLRKGAIRVASKLERLLGFGGNWEIIRTMQMAGETSCLNPEREGIT